MRLPIPIVLLVAFVAVETGCKRASPPAAEQYRYRQESPEKPPATSPPQTQTPAHTPGSTSGPSVVEQRIHGVWRGDLDGIAKRRILRVLVTPDKLGFFFNGADLQGAIYEMVNDFETFLNKRLDTGNLKIEAAFIPVAREKLIPMLAEGKGDLVASLVGVSDQRRKIVEFSTPLYDKAKFIIVTGPGSERLSGLNDLSGKEVYFTGNSVPFENLARLNETFKREGKKPVTLTPSDPNLQQEDLLEMANAGLIPMTLADEKLAQYWSMVLPNLKPQPNVVVAEGSVAWAMQRDTPKLKAAVDDFVGTHRVGTAYGNTILRKYLRDTKWAKEATSRGDLIRFRELVDYFNQYGDKYDLPYLLLAAQGYQESRLNQNLKSPAGAVGVMQIKPSTAAAPPIGIVDIERPDRNIEAGAKYLRYMVNRYYADEPMDRVTKGLFALASYNAGPNRIQKLRTQAATEGYDPNRWFMNVEIMASRDIGAETVQYVSNIYKYYLAYEMITAKDREHRKALEKDDAAGR